MSTFKYILRSLTFYRKNHLTVLLGTMLSTAILTGALIIGDSVRGSLGDLLEKRLGNVEFVLDAGDRFVTDGLNETISGKINSRTAAVLKLNGIAVNPATSNRINHAQVLGVDENFWKLAGLKNIALKKDQVIISDNLAHRLELGVGDELLLRVEKKGFVPSNAPFVQDEETSAALRLEIVGIADKNKFGRFSLQSNQVAPYNVFVSKDFLDEEIEMSGFSNLLLLENPGTETSDLLRSSWTASDAGIILEKLKNTNQIELRSRRIFLEENISQVILNEFTGNEILTYLVNTIMSKKGETPYSFASGMSAFDYLKKDEVVINQWLADDLKVRKGDSLQVDFYVIGSMRKLVEERTSFVVKEIIPTGQAGLDNSLMPPFPGIATSQSCNDWETGVPVDLERIRDKDEAYWNCYKGTPKLYLSYKTAETLWANRFGKHTAIRFDVDKVSIDELNETISAKLDPKDLGLQFRNVRKEGDYAVANAIGFDELFLSLSFFVIVASILLTSLLYALNIESRRDQSGVMAALGFSKRKIKRLHLYESLLIAIVGGVAGALLGILYNELIMRAINSIWNDIVRTNELDIIILPRTLFIGAMSGIIIALIIIYWVNIRKLRAPVIQLIKKVNTVSIERPQYYCWSWLVALLAFCAVIVIFLSGSLADPNSLMIASALFLVSCFSMVKFYMNKVKHRKAVPDFNVISLIKRNISLNQTRSLSVIILLALGTFTILITGGNRKTFYGQTTNAQSGTGGYLFWAETSLPVLNDLNASGDFDGLDFVQFHQLSGDDASCLNLNQVTKPRILGVDPTAFDRKQAFGFQKLDPSVDAEHPWKYLEQELGENVIPAYADQTVIVWGLMMNVGDTLYYNSEDGERIAMVLKAGLKPSIFQGNLLIADQFFTKYFPSVSGSKMMLVGGSVEKEVDVRDELLANFMDHGIEIQRTDERLAEFNSVTNTYLTVFMILGGLGVLIGTIGLGVILIRNLLDRKHEIALLQAVGFSKSKILGIIFYENFALLLLGIIIGFLASAIGLIPSIISNAFEMQLDMMLLIILLVFISGVLWIYFSAKRMLKLHLVENLKIE